MIQLEPFPDAALLNRAYPQHYSDYVPLGQRGRVFRMLRLAAHAVLRRKLRRVVKPGDRVLDVGCGVGGFLLQLRRVGVSNAEGIDCNEHAVHVARSRGLTVHLGQFVDTELPRKYNHVYFNNYLEHVLDPRAALRKAHDLLLAGGRLAGEVPNFTSVDRRLFGKYWGGTHVPRHTFQFAAASLRRLLSDTGFVDVSVGYSLSPTTYALSVQNFLRRSADVGREGRRRAGARAPYYSALLVLFFPAQLVSVLLRRGGLMTFAARRPVA